MHRRDQNHSFLQPGGRATLLDVVGDVDVLLALLRCEGQIGSVRFHAGWPSSSRPACHDSPAFSSKRARHSPSDVTVGSKTSVCEETFPSAPMPVNSSRSTH